MVFGSSVIAAVCAVLVGSAAAGNPSSLATKDELCSLVPASYAGAKTANPELAFAIDELEKHSIATWYTDRVANGGYASIAQQLVSTCPESSRLSVVVYGLPKKDCDAGYSSSGAVQSTDDYINFVQTLVDTIGSRKVLYVLEPDAVGLLAKDGGCGEAAGYRANLKTAIQMLSQNANADIYIDVGYWSLAYAEPRQRVLEVVTDLVSAGGRVKGITLNTSNYRKTSEVASLCTSFQNDMAGTAQINCIVDTSRNYNGSPSTEWCNVAEAGIGQPPSGNTGISNIDYFLWVKVPGESDGPCDGSSHMSDAMKGPAAGDFFVDGFKKLWDQGFFVDSKNMAKFDGSAPAPTPDATSVMQNDSPLTPEPTTSTPAPEPTTATPETTAPTATTPAPETTTPMATTPAAETTTPMATTPAPETTMPMTTTPAPEVATPTLTPTTPTPTPVATTATPVPDSTTPVPGSAPETTTVAPTETPAPTTTTVSPTPTMTTATPSSGITDMPSLTPVVTVTPSSSSSSSGSSVGTSTVGIPPMPPTKKPKHPTKKPLPSKTPKPTTTSSSSSSSSNDVVQNATPAVDGGPNTIAQNSSPSVDGGPSTIASSPTANTKSGDGSTSATGGIIAAVLVAAVALAVAAAMFIHVRRRAQDATADEMKTPASLDPAHPAYLAQL